MSRQTKRAKRARTSGTTLADALRDAIAAAPALLPIERETGVYCATLRRFREGRQTLRLDIADRLATYFGIRVVTPRTRRKG